MRTLIVDDDLASRFFLEKILSMSRITITPHPHESVNHREKEWVRGDVYTDGAENAWSLFKRSIIGSYHKISTKHMDAYLDELDWRFNNRENPHLFWDTMVRLLNTPKMEFRDLIEKPA